MAELGHGARHVIGRGDDDEGAESARLRPPSGLDRIADRIDGRMIEIDAASKQPLMVQSAICAEADIARASVPARTTGPLGIHATSCQHSCSSRGNLPQAFVSCQEFDKAVESTVEGDLQGRRFALGRQV